MILSLMTTLSLLSSCNIGVKQKTIVVFSSPYKSELDKGLAVIATNKKIKIVLKTKNGQYYLKKDLGGMYVISKSQFEAIKKQIFKDREN